MRHVTLAWQTKQIESENMDRVDLSNALIFLERMGSEWQQCTNSYIYKPNGTKNEN